METDNIMMTAETKPVTIEKEHKFATQIFIFTVLFAVTAIGVYLSFIVCDRTFLRYANGNIDGMAQTYPSYMSLKLFFEKLFDGEGVNAWSWSIGLGGSYFDFFKGKIVNLFTYIAIAFPEEYLDIGHNVATIMRQYASGIVFLYFAREIELKQNQRIIGALCYTFSGWIIMATVNQGHFTNATIFFPLIIMGTEKVLKKKSPYLFIFSVFLLLSANVLWAYISAIIVIIYYTIRYFYYYRGVSAKEFFRDLMIYFGYGIVGILISACFVVSMFYSMSNATTVTNVDASACLYTLKEYLTMPVGFFEIESIHEPYSYIYLPVIGVMMVPAIILNIKRKSTPAILTTVLFIAGLFPIIGRFFNGLSYTTGRWYFVLEFFFAWAAVECLDKEIIKSKKILKLILVWILFLGIWSIGVCYCWLDIINLQGLGASLVGVGFGLIIIALYYIREHSALKINSMQIAGIRIINIIIVIILIGSIIGAANMEFYPGISERLYGFSKRGEIYEKFSDSSQRVVKELQNEDNSFFRTDQVDGYSDKRICRVQSNENIMFDNRSIYTYFSTMDSKWHEFNRMMGNNCGYFDRTTSFSNDNRAALDFLMGVKYFVGDSVTKKPGASQYAPYGFDSYETIEGVDILKNKYSMGLGTAYKQYITESEFEVYTPLVREQVLMQAAVIPDEYESMMSGVHHATNIQTEIEEIHYSINDIDNMDFDSEGKITVYNGGGTFKLTIPEVKNRQIILSFDNLVRKKCQMEDELLLSDKTWNDVKGNEITKYIKKVSYHDDEKFSINVTKGAVEKAALNRKSKNQGFDTVTDFNINLGYYDSIDGDISIAIDNFGYYKFDSIKIYAMPMDIYDENAKLLEDAKYNISEYGNDRITGTTNNEKDSILYFSILNNPGWKIYIDGKEVEKINNVNISFTGAKIPKGEHKVELVYSYPGLKMGLILTVLGVVCVIIIAVYRRRLNKK